MSLIQIAPPPPPKPPTPKVDDFWVLARSACYLGGRGVTFGPPLLQVQAINPGVFSIPLSLQKTPGVAAMDDSFRIFADGSLDHVLVTPLISHIVNPESLLRDAISKLKKGGHLVILQPPSLEMLAQLAHWQLKCDHTENGKRLVILKKVEGRRGIDPIPARVGKRACIARYGALGDAIIMTPLVRQLAEDGYQVTLNISSYCAPIFENNPHISNLLIQERDLIPNHLLGRYWQIWEREYDRYINLSESIEGDLLMVEGRAPFFTSKSWRNRVANHNYYDYTMARGGYTDRLGTRGELFFTTAENRRADREWAQWKDKFVVLWALNGSSHHKKYPMMEALLREWFTSHPSAICVTTGDSNAQAAEFPHPQLIGRAGVWSIREALAAVSRAGVVIGPETMITNAVGCYSNPKIVLLSHSSRENLTKYFLEDHSLEPDQSISPCYPCHQLHYSLESCPSSTLEDTVTGETLGTAPSCTLAIQPERIMAELNQLYDSWLAKKGLAQAA